MILCIEKEILSAAAEIFEILTPITLCLWFLHSQWAEAKRAYYKEFSGFYGGFVNDTINKNTQKLQFHGGLLMEIFDIDDNGYFRGQFEYFETEVTLGRVGGPEATERMVASSINFFYGRLNFRWNFKFRKPNPVLWNTNRIYKGNLSTIDRLDRLTDNESETLERVFKLTHYRESSVIVFALDHVNKKSFELPQHFTVWKTAGHLLDPYTNVVRIFKEPYYARKL